MNDILQSVEHTYPPEIAKMRDQYLEPISDLLALRQSSLQPIVDRLYKANEHRDDRRSRDEYHKLRKAEEQWESALKPFYDHLATLECFATITISIPAEQVERQA